MNIKATLCFLAALLPALFTGCSTRYAEYGGIRYEMISEEEEEKLVMNARLTVSHISKRLSPGEMQVVEKTPPQVKIVYSDHRFGEATVKWDLPQREVGVSFAGEFLGEHMTSMVFTREKQPEVLDFTKGRKLPPSPRRTVPKTRRK